MSEINPTYNDRIKYELYQKDFGTVTIPTDPIDWNSDRKEWARNEDYHGVVAKFSNNLGFINEAADFINMIFGIYDVLGEIKLSKYEKHPETDIWTKTYWGYLDLFTREIDGDITKVKFNSGGLEVDLKAREDESVEIDRLTTIDGKLIGPLVPQVVALNGRKIFLKSKWEIDPTSTDVIDLSVFSDDGNTRSETEGFPFKLTSKSHEEAQSVIFNSEGNVNNGSTGMMFLAQFDRTRTMRIIGTNITFKVNITRGMFPREYDWAIFRASLVIYSDNLNYNVKNRITFVDPGSNFDSIHNQTFTFSFDQTVTVEKGDSIALEIYLQSDLKNGLSGKRVTINLSQLGGKLVVDENSYFPASKSKFVLMHELLNRLATICTNKENIFKSDFFGRTDIGYAQDGIAAYNGVSHGFWIRQFDKLPINDENKFKPISTSFKESMQSLSSIWNVALGIETINNRELIRVEDFSYFYTPIVTIKLPNQVSKLKRIVAEKYYYKSVEIGYVKGGEYEEAQGLDEPNCKANYTTIMNKGKVFTALSPYRADSYGMEFARRKPLSDYSTTDTSYDSDVFVLDLKKGNTAVYQQRLWQDDFLNIPTGIFSPETATNLRLSPINMLYRNSTILSNCLKKYPGEYVRYGSSTGNSKLKTKMKVASGGNGNEYAEDGNFLNSELKRSRFIPEYIEFEHEVDFFISQEIEKFTMYKGKRIPNLYGMVEFINDKMEIERGYFISLKPNGKGNWKLIKAS